MGVRAYLNGQQLDQGPDVWDDPLDRLLPDRVGIPGSIPPSGNGSRPPIKTVREPAGVNAHEHRSLWSPTGSVRDRVDKHGGQRSSVVNGNSSRSGFGVDFGKVR
jgi:hypothetical protein